MERNTHLPYLDKLLSRLEKVTMAVRETVVSRHNKGPIKGPLKYHNTIVL